MNFIDPVTPLASLMIADPMSASSVQNASAPNFANWFLEELNGVNNKLNGAERTSIQAALGESTSLHRMMIDMEEARLSFQLIAQVRNRLLDAYQEVMRMSV